MINFLLHDILITLFCTRLCTWPWQLITSRLRKLSIANSDTRVFGVPLLSLVAHKLLLTRQVPYFLIIVSVIVMVASEGENDNSQAGN